MNLKKIKESVVNLFNSNRNIPWWILSGVIISFILILYVDLVPIRHTYNLGDIADKDIKASEDFFVEDKDATEANRRVAADNVPTVYDFDSLLSSKLSQQLTTAFRDIRNALESDIFKTQDLETNLDPAEVSDRSLKLKREFEKRIGFTVPKSIYILLEKNGFSEDVPNIIIAVLSRILGNGVVADKDFLLKEAEKGIILRDIESKNEILTYELNSFYSPEEAKGLIKSNRAAADKRIEP